MKFVAIIEYGPDEAKIKSVHAAHREYLRRFLDNGQLFAAGPFAEGRGALWILDAEDETAVDLIVKGDPFVAAGVIVDWKIRRLAYWSAQEAKGAK